MFSPVLSNILTFGLFHRTVGLCTTLQKIVFPPVFSDFILNYRQRKNQLTMSSSTIERLEKNAEVAENLIAEIYSKIEEIEKKTGGKGGDVNRLQLENEHLRDEIKKWREHLIIRQIRNGKKYIPVPGTSSANRTQPVPAAVNPGKGTQSQTCSLSSSSQKSQPAPAPTPKAAPSRATGTGAGPKVPNKPNDQNQSAVQPGKVGASKQSPEAVKPKSDVAPEKVKQHGGGGGAKPSTPGPVEVVDVSRLDFRIGKIVEVDKHPDADTLYLEKVDVGEPKPRTVVSGLVRHVPIEAMRNRMVVLLCNLKPAKMRGITSEAMVMCASTPEKVEILIPPQGAVPGDLVDFEGFTRKPDDVLNPKKKVFETVAPDLKTDGKRVATYKGIPFEVKGKGVVTSESLTLVNIK